MKLVSLRFAAVVIVSALVLSACGSSSKTSAPSLSTVTDTGVGVAGGFGVKPTVTIPDGSAPAKLTQQVLTQGTGVEVDKGDTLIANYLGETWAPKNGKPAIFDSSFDRSAAAFVIGVGNVIPGWDKTLVGKKVGSRVLLTLPPADGYGTAGQSSAGITGTDTLVFVVDLVNRFKPDASAPGTVPKSLNTAGLPKIDNVPGKPPTITSVSGVAVPTTPTSTLLVSGMGEKIDTAKTLVLQLVQTDIATGTKTHSSWGKRPTTAAAQSVLGIATKLAGQKIGSRAVVLLPAVAAAPATSTQAARAAAPPEVLVIDVVGQF